MARVSSAVFLEGNMITNRYAEVERTLDQMFNRLLELSRKSYEYCPGVSLYPNEIHTVEYIAVTSSTNMTDIANRMGLTKGAVSKMIAKLENQGLLERYKYQPSQKDIYIHLTELGVQAYEGHRIYHTAMDKQLADYFSTLDQEHQGAILDFLEKYLHEMNTL